MSDVGQVFVDLCYYGTVDRNVHEGCDDRVGEDEVLELSQNLWHSLKSFLCKLAFTFICETQYFHMLIFLRKAAVLCDGEPKGDW